MGCRGGGVGDVLPVIDRVRFASFDSFLEADEADKRERWALSPIERLELLERLRRQMYPDGETAPRLQRVLEIVESP